MTFPLLDTYGYFSSEKKDEIDKQSVKREKERALWHGTSSKIGLLMGGCLLATGGVFFVLAAHQFLPQGANAITQLGVGGFLMGYGALGIGTIAAGVALYQVYQTLKPRLANWNQDQMTLRRLYAEDLTEALEVFREKIGQTECLAFDNEMGMVVILTAGNLFKLTYSKESSAAAELEKWQGDHPEVNFILDFKTFYFETFKPQIS